MHLSPFERVGACVMMKATPRKSRFPPMRTCSTYVSRDGRARLGDPTIAPTAGDGWGPFAALPSLSRPRGLYWALQNGRRSRGC